MDGDRIPVDNKKLNLTVAFQMTREKFYLLNRDGALELWSPAESDGDNMPPKKKLKLGMLLRESSAPLAVNNVEKEPKIKVESDDWRIDNWRGRLAYAQKNDHLCDVTFVVEDQEFRAHKLFLAMASEPFQAMFYGAMAEKGDRVVITDLTVDGFKALLEYIYTNEISLSSIDEGCQLWVAADKYCVPHVKAECNKYFASCDAIVTNSLWATLQTALFLDIDVLVKKCFRFIEEFTEFVMLSDDFEKISVAAMISFLSLTFLNASEVDLMKGLIKWGHARIEEKPEMSLKTAVEPCIKFIRFGAMTMEDFCSILDSSDESRKAFSDADALAIMKHLAKPTAYSLPEWCCQTLSKRCRKKLPPAPPIESEEAGPSQLPEVLEDDISTGIANVQQRVAELQAEFPEVRENERRLEDFSIRTQNVARQLADIRQRFNDDLTSTSEDSSSSESSSSSSTSSSSSDTSDDFPAPTSRRPAIQWTSDSEDGDDYLPPPARRRSAKGKTTAPTKKVCKKTTVKAKIPKKK